jgi:hypothetical protein
MQTHKADHIPVRTLKCPLSKAPMVLKAQSLSVRAALTTSFRATTAGLVGNAIVPISHANDVRVFLQRRIAHDHVEMKPAIESTSTLEMLSPQRDHDASRTGMTQKYADQAAWRTKRRRRTTW